MTGIRHPIDTAMFTFFFLDIKFKSIKHPLIHQTIGLYHYSEQRLERFHIFEV